MKNDQFFIVGDKVMRVTPNSVPGNFPYDGLIPRMGVVYCIEDFWEGPEFNVVMLVGFGGFKYDLRNRPVGWRAIHFRKVEEIRLCHEAVIYHNANAPKPIITP